MYLGNGAHLRANGIRQHYLRFSGEGPDLLIVPGIVSPAVLWQHVAEWLARDFNTFILDVRGRGLSEAGAHLDYGVDTCAQDVVAFSQAAGLNKPLVLGHSMGARIALRAAALAQGQFGGIVLIDPPTSGPGRRAYPVPKARTLAMLRAAVKGHEPDAPAPAGASTWPTELESLRAEWLVTCDERAVHVAYDDFHHEDCFADLAQTTEPVSILCAGNGGVVSDADLDDMRRLRPDIVSIRLAGVGHQMQAENFDIFKLALTKILDQHLQHLQGS